MDDDLTRLRAQIDQIDQQILALLSDRLMTADKVAAAKQNGSSVFRPERESQLLSRLCGQAEVRLHPVIQAVWRAIISAAIARQNPRFTIGATASSEQTAQLFAAGQLAIENAENAVELCEKIAAGSLDIGIIEAADLAAVHSLLGLDKSVKIIAALPLFRNPSQLPSAFVLATDRPDASEHDRYVVYHLNKAECKIRTAEELTALSGLSDNLSGDLSVLGICTSIG